MQKIKNRTKIQHTFQKALALNLKNWKSDLYIRIYNNVISIDNRQDNRLVYSVGLMGP